MKIHHFRNPCTVSCALATHNHYIDVVMTTMASQITSLTVVYSTVYSAADQRKHQSSASLAFVWGIHRDRWIPRTKGQLRGKCFHLVTSSWMVLKRVPDTLPDASIYMADEDSSTCLEAALDGHLWLQVVFTFPNSPINRNMSVEVVVNNELDCSSSAWTWFMASNCSEIGFLECQKSPVDPREQLNKCVVTCQCPTPCDYLYLKFTPVVYLDQSVDAICEVYLLYDPVKPEPRGKLPWCKRWL